jgi:hypothetical protein
MLSLFLPIFFPPVQGSNARVRPLHFAGGAVVHSWGNIQPNTHHVNFRFKPVSIVWLVGLGRLTKVHLC